MDKFLIVGLGNPGDGYAGTRHNVGYMVLDAFAKASNIVFEDRRYGFIASTSVKGRKIFLLKPTTFINLSGNAVRYWMNKENIDIERLMVVSDDIALPVGTLRLRKKGGDGGHNGLGNIQSVIGTQDYARMRIGIGNDFTPGSQIDYVLSDFLPEEAEALAPTINTAIEAIKSFALAGIDNTMNQFNRRKPAMAAEGEARDGGIQAPGAPEGAHHQEGDGNGRDGKD